MRILGVDPGTRIAGYGIVDLFSDGRVRGISAGVWRFDAELALAARLGALARELARVIEVYQPQKVCVEQAFVAQNIRSALFLGHARGVVLANCHQAGLGVFELSPTAVKKAVLAHGRSSKEEIARALSSILGISFENLPHDASDALGIAYAHAMREKIALAQGTSVEAMADQERRAAQLQRRRGGSRWASLETLPRSGKKQQSGFEQFLTVSQNKKTS